jgi:hypothetical protein
MDPPHDIPALLPDSEPIESTFGSVEMKLMFDGDPWGTRTNRNHHDPLRQSLMDAPDDYYSPQRVG